MRDLWLDLRFAARSLSRTPGFTLAALATLALGLGAGVAIFGVVDGVLLRRLPYERPDELVRVWPQRPFSGALYDELRSRTRALAATSALERDLVGWVQEGEPEELLATRVTPGHFELLGVAPLLGRGFTEEEGRPGGESVVVLGWELWQRRFGGSGDVLGRRVEIDGAPATIVGVLPRSHRPVLRSGEIWMPLAIDPADEHRYRDNFNYAVVGRLAKGRDIEAATAELSALLAELERRDPGSFRPEELASAGVAELKSWMLGERAERLLLLAGAVVLLLLVACVNVANLLLARLSTRRDELAVRSALGAGRARVARVVLTESVLLGLAGGGLGLLVAEAVLQLARSRLQALFPTAAAIGVDARVFAFALLLSLSTGLVFGVAPALHAVREGPGAVLRGTTAHGGMVGAHRHRLQRALVLAEVALALVLVVGATLVGKSLWRLLRQDLGLTRDGVLTMRLSPPQGRFPDDASLQAFYREVLERAGAVPGVVAVGLVNLLPLDGGIMGTTIATREHPRIPGEAPMGTDVRIVSPDTFRALGVPLLRGRGLSEADREAPAGLINRSLAERLWPGEDPLGREILWDDGSEWFTVVGVVADMRQRGPAEAPRAEAYRLVSQEVWSRTMYLVARGGGDPGALAGPLVAAVHRADPSTPVSRVRTLRDVGVEALAQERFVTLLFALFGATALALGAVGVYGVTSFALAQRRRELGVRLALGATSGSLLRGALAEALRPVLLGLALGVLLCLAFARALSVLLFRVDPLDPAVLAGVALALTLVAGLAAWAPARRAATTDPRDSLLSS